MVVQIFLIITQATRVFLLSVDQIIPVSKGGMSAAPEVAEVGHVGLRHLDIFLLN